MRNLVAESQLLSPTGEARLGNWKRSNSIGWIRAGALERAWGALERVRSSFGRRDTVLARGSAYQLAGVDWALLSKHLSSSGCAYHTWASVRIVRQASITGRFSCCL